MASIFSGPSPLLPWAIGLLGVIGLPNESACGADEAESSAAESRHADGNVLAPLRDPKMRRWMLDRYDAQRLEIPHGNEETQWGGKVNGIEWREETDGLGPAPRSGEELPPEIRRVQEALGGPAVDQFPSLRSAGRPVWPLAADQTPPRNVMESVRALRDAAVQLDEAASRLEQLDLYRQADALRGQAQQLRLDARKLLGHGPNINEGATTPAVWPSSATAPATRLAPSSEPQPNLPPRLHAIPPQPMHDAPPSAPVPSARSED